MGIAKSISLQQAQTEFQHFCDERGWKLNGPEFVMLLNEEAGEVSKEVRYLHFKKAENPAETVERLGEELVDVFYNVCMLANLYGIDLNEAYARKFAKIVKKYPA